MKLKRMLAILLAGVLVLCTFNLTALAEALPENMEIAAQNNVEASSAVAKIGSEEYASIALALEEANPGDEIQLKSGTYDAFEVLKSVTITGMDENTEITIKSTKDTAFIGVGADDVTIKGLKFIVPETVDGTQNWMTSVIGYASSQYNYGGVEPDGWDIENCEFVQEGNELSVAIFNVDTFSVKDSHFKNFEYGINAMGDGSAMGTVTISGNEFVQVDYPLNIYWGQAGTEEDTCALSITGNDFVSAKSEETVTLLIDDYAMRNAGGTSIKSLAVTGNTYTGETDFVLVDSSKDTAATVEETAKVVKNYTSVAIAEENLAEGETFYMNYGNEEKEAKGTATESGIEFIDFAEVADSVAFVDGTYYSSLAAIPAEKDKAGEKVVIELLDDVIMDYGVLFENATNITINGNDHTITLKNNAVHQAAYDTWVENGSNTSSDTRAYSNPYTAANQPTGFSVTNGSNTSPEGSVITINDAEIVNQKSGYKVIYRNGHDFRTSYYTYAAADKAVYNNVDFVGGVSTTKNAEFYGCTFTEDESIRNDMYCLFIDNEYSAVGADVSVIIEDCEFNPGDIYGTVKAANKNGQAEISVSGSTFTNCPNKPAINADTNMEMTFTNNTFTGCENGIYDADSGTINGVDVQNTDAVAAAVAAINLTTEDAAYITTVNEVQYTDLETAIENAGSDSVIQLNAGTFTVGDVKFPATLSNVTIRGAENKGTILKDSSLRSADGSAVTYTGITIDGIVFDNSNLIFTGARSGEEIYRDWTITGCEFKNIVREGNYAALHFANSAGEPMTNFTLSNTVIDGVSGSSNSALVMQSVDGIINITGNTVKNAAWNAFQIMRGDADTSISFVNNEISGIGAEEGIFNLYNNVGPITLSGNTVKKSAEGQAFFGNVSTGITLGEGNTWLDEEGNTIENPGFEAAIGNVYYVTRAEAMAAAGEDDTVTLLTDVEITTAETWASNVDLNGNTLTVTAGGITADGDVTVSGGDIVAKDIETEETVFNSVSFKDVTIDVENVTNAFGVSDTASVTWENVNATITDCGTGVQIAEGGALTIAGNSTVLVTGSTGYDMEVEGTLTVEDDNQETTTKVLASKVNEGENATTNGTVLVGYTEKPVISPEGGTFKGSVSITITCPTEGAAIYYTTDGTEPTVESTLYTGKITISEIGEYTVSAIAVGDKLMESDAVSAEFIVKEKPRYKSTSISTTTSGGATEDADKTETPENPGETENKDETENNNGTAEFPFIDVEKDFWGYEGIAYCYENGIMNGMADDTFEPETVLSRAMVTTMLYRLAGEPEVETEGTEWYAKARAWAMEKGISDGTSMENTITREQFVTMLYRYANADKADVAALGAFTDSDAISEYAKEAVAWATANAIMNGMGDGTVAPQASATRAQAAAIFMRFAELTK